MINPITPANPLMTSAELHPHQTMAPQMGQPTGMTHVFQPPLSLLNPSSPPIDVKPPVHTIDHTQLKRGKELGQVERSLISIKCCMYVCMCIITRLHTD